MLIHGSVEGNILSTSDVTFTGSSSCTGDITSDNLVMSGKARGKILCTSTVELAGAGQVEGVMKAARFIMSEDSVFEGSLQIKKPAKPKKAQTPDGTPADQDQNKKA
jgi:cytoskeletal protein CcmA (bactofilin family)